MSAVQARVHFSLKQELKLLKHIIAEYTPEEYDYDPSEGDRRAKKSDYDNVDVIPVSDPNASTMAQKIVQYQAVLQLAQSAPQMYNMPLLHRQMLEVLGIKNAAKLIPMPEDMVPVDPISENQNILMMKPVKAFISQDHQAHIAVHMSAMQDPKIASLLQNNPMAQQLQSAMMAHINEHLGFQYRVEIEQQLGFSLPPQMDSAGEEVHMDPQAEARLAPMLAMAAQRLLAMNQGQAAQQQAQQQAQDPIVQMQQQELQLKAQEVQRKSQKDLADIALRKKQLEMDALKTAAQIKQQNNREHANMQMDALKTAAQLRQDQVENERSHAMDAVKHATTLAQQEAMADKGHAVDLHKHNMQMKAAQNKPKPKGE